MRLLITGGQGFIARSLVNELSKSKKYTIFAPSRNELDLLDDSALNVFFLNNDIDIIIHTANKASIITSEIVEENLRMFFNIVQYASKVERIIHLGSGAEYSKNTPIVNVTEDQADGPLPKDGYGFYKSVCSRYIQQSNNIVNLRIFGCYGELEDYTNKFISNAIIKNILHQPININQNVYFDYIYIDDLIDIITYFIHNKPKYKVYNASSGSEIDLLCLANIVNEVGTYSSKIKVVNQELNNEYTSNNSLLLSEITSLTLTPHLKAIQKMYDYFTQNIKSIDKEKVIKDLYSLNCNTKWIEEHNE